MKDWKDIFSSAVFRLTVIVLAVVIPLNLLALILGGTVIDEVERQVSLETQNALQLYMGQIDDALSRIGVRLYVMAHEDADFSRLAEKEITGDDEYYRQQQSLVRLTNTLDDMLDDNTLIGGLYAWFPEKELFITKGGTNLQSTAARDYIRENAGSDALNARQGWRLVTASGEPFLLVAFSRRSSFYGAWISLRDLGRTVGLYAQEGGAARVFTDRSGEIRLASQDLASQLDLTAPNQRYGGKSYTLVRAESKFSQLCYVQILSKDQMSRSLPLAIRVLQILSVAAVLIVPVIIIAMRKWVKRPVDLLMEAMSRIEQGDVDYRIPQGRAGSEFDRINSNFNRMMDEVSELKISVYEQKIKNERIRLGFLSRQIQPHFILNALNILYSYEPEEYLLSRKMILCLSKYFRYVVNANADFVELGQEMEHIRNYFEIQQARFPRAFRAAVEYDGELADCLIPPFILQNFSENAIKFAFIPDQVVEITVRAWREGERLRCCVCDTGAGIPEQVLERIGEFRKTHEFQESLGVGIQNTIDRLSLIYGEEARLEIVRRDPRGTRIDIDLPVMRKERSCDECDPD